MTKLEFLARTEIDETTLEDSAGAIDHFFELSLQHAFWRYLVLGVSARTKLPILSAIRRSTAAPRSGRPASIISIR